MWLLLYYFTFKRFEQQKKLFFFGFYIHWPFTKRNTSMIIWFSAQLVPFLLEVKEETNLLSCLFAEISVANCTFYFFKLLWAAEIIANCAATGQRESQQSAKRAVMSLFCLLWPPSPNNNLSTTTNFLPETPLCSSLHLKSPCNCLLTFTLTNVSKSTPFMLAQLIGLANIQFLLLQTCSSPDVFYKSTSF